MKIQQISIFLENATGRMAEVTRILKDGGINLRAIMVADTADFGILRIIADNPEKAIEILHNANFTTKTKGSGLGLAICKSIVTQSHGDIYYSKSKELGGADFTVVLPIFTEVSEDYT